MLELLDVLEWDTLPARTQPVAAMLADGYNETEVARTLGLLPREVRALTGELGAAMVAQAREHAEELSAACRDWLEGLRAP